MKYFNQKFIIETLRRDKYGGLHLAAKPKEYGLESKAMKSYNSLISTTPNNLKVKLFCVHKTYSADYKVQLLPKSTLSSAEYLDDY